MRLDIDLKGGAVAFDVSAKVYSEKAVEIAAHVFERRAEVAVGTEKGRLGVELTARRKGATEEDLRQLAGDFVNELLNQEYRFLVGAFNRRISDLVLTQALYSARGGEQAPPKADESSPEFKADVERMLREAEEEIRRTMPKKLPPQGNPLPPEKELG